MIRGGLLTRYYLEEGIRQSAAYRRLDSHLLAQFTATIAEHWLALEAMAHPSEAETESEFIFPLFQRLQWQFLPQQEPGKGRKDVADALLFLSAGAKAAATRLRDHSERFCHGVVVVENEARDTSLDRGSEKREPPSSQTLRYLKRADGIPGSTVRWAVLTNGRLWRLYWAGARARAEGFIEFDLPAIIGVLAPPVPDGAPADHWTRVFFLLFCRDALQPDSSGRTFLDEALAEGRRYEERITGRISEAVFDRVFPALADALAAADPAPSPHDPAWRAGVKQATIILLFRFLFILYAEDRDLLPVAHPGYRHYSLGALRDEAADIVDSGRPVPRTARIWWQRIVTLFAAISAGDRALGLPAYNGGLFKDDSVPLLARITLTDSDLVPILGGLSRADPGGGKRRINYRDLNVQQLGAIYEQLLERDIVETGGKVKVAPNDTARHQTGSFFTPDELVALIISRAVAPMVEERREAFRLHAAKLSSDRRPKPERLADLVRFDPAAALLDLRVCDPAMGSGHFLVSLVDFLAFETLTAMADSPALVTWAEYRSPVAERIEAIRVQIRRQAIEHGWEAPEERLDDEALIRRIILKRVVHGVDLNPLAVELAKLALWLHCFTVGAPLSFLDHHLRCGNAVLGETVGQVKRELEDSFGLTISPAVQGALRGAAAMARIEESTDADLHEVESSATAFAEMQEDTRAIRSFLDLCTARRLLPPQGAAQEFGVEGLFGGDYGDPFEIASGRSSGRAPREDAASARRKGRREKVSAKDAFSGLGDWLGAARALASEQWFLHWQAVFPGVWTEWESIDPRGGFDAVIGNPPYVRQEQIRTIKPALQALYPESYDGVADLYVYFYARGLHLLKKGGRLSFVVTNKWLKAGYAEKLRALLGAESWIEAVIDFGHAKGFFPDADVMPSVLAVRRPDPAVEDPATADVAVIPRDAVDMTTLPDQVKVATFSVPRTRLVAGAWVLEAPEVMQLLDKIRGAGPALIEYAGVSPRRGVLTGFNEAFVVDGATRERLICEDARSEELIRPYLRGQDIDRWVSDWAGQWMIFTRHGTEIDAYPAIKAHLAAFRRELEPKPADWRPIGDAKEWLGRKPGHYRWYEIQDNVAYWRQFQAPKTVYNDIMWRAQFCVDRTGAFLNNTAYFLPCDDPWLLACLNASLGWWFSWRAAQHAKDEALRYFNTFVEAFPIAEPDVRIDDVHAAISALSKIHH